MRIVYRAEGLIDANLLKDRLEAAGIPALIGGQYLTGGMGELPVAGLVTVSVPNDWSEEAEIEVREFERALRAECEQDDALPDDGGLSPA